MAIPPNAIVWTQAMDPTDLVDYRIPLAGRLLEEDEAIESYELEPWAEATALGLIIHDSGDRAHQLTLDNTAIDLWFEIDAEFHDDASFDGSGVTLPITLTIQTDATPSRRRQITLVLKVANQ